MSFDINEHRIKKFVSFVKDGYYSEMKQKERFLKQAKTQLRTELQNSDMKRHEFIKSGMVAKFVRQEIRKVNHEGIIEELFNYITPEYACSLLTLDTKALKEADIMEKAEVHQIPTSHYIRPYLNKVGKSYYVECDYLFGGQSQTSLIEEIRDEVICLKSMQANYEEVKVVLRNALVAQKKKKLVTPVGSVSLIANTPTWDMNGLYKDFGVDFFLSFGKVKISELEQWIAGGAVPMSVLTANRVVHDTRLDFVVISLEDEERMMNAYRYNKTQQSLAFGN